MKKLNRKGFTLIELLAVIVILAIIVVVTVPTIISTIADARVSSIWNLAGSVANSYDTATAQELLSPGKALGGIEVTTTWTCIGDTSLTGTKGTLIEVLDLSATDLNLSATGAPSTSNQIVKADGTIDASKITKDTCSAIRVKANGAAEVLLVSNTNSSSKFAISGKVVYALSSADAGGTNNITG